MRFLALVACLVTGSALAGCTPSLRMLHESTVYFERCHAAELSDEVPLETKAACWERWLRWYSASQTGTRILYARERLVYLAQGELVDPLPVADSAAVEVSTDVQGTSGSDSVARTTRDPGLPHNPRRAGHPVCEPVCRPAWDACINRCEATERTRITACQTEYASCMSGCI